MSESTFSSEDECSAFVAKLLRAQKLSPEVARSIAAHLASVCEEKRAPRLGLQLRVSRWVIKQEDLGFFTVFSAGTVAGATAMSGEPVSASIVGALAAIAEMGWRLWRKGVRLEPLDVRVLLLLEHSAGGLVPGDIAKGLSDKTKTWSAKEVKAVLNRLSMLPTRSGTIAVVEQIAGGKWRHTH